VEFKDYFLWALAFCVAGVLMMLLRDSQLRGNYPMFEDFLTVSVSFECLAAGLVLAGVVWKVWRVKK
jgi:hypothetical protein